MSSVQSMLFPEPPRRLPHSRWWNIAARTVHVGATGVLLGGHVFDVPAGQLYALLWLAIATGAALVFIEVYPSAHWAHQVCALFVYVKLALLCLILVFWEERVWILLGVLGVASVGSHAPRRVRHYSIWLKKVMVD